MLWLDEDNDPGYACPNCGLWLDEDEDHGEPEA